MQVKDHLCIVQNAAKVRGDLKWPTGASRGFGNLAVPVKIAKGVEGQLDRIEGIYLCKNNWQFVHQNPPSLAIFGQQARKNTFGSLRQTWRESNFLLKRKNQNGVIMMSIVSKRRIRNNSICYACYACYVWMLVMLQSMLAMKRRMEHNRNRIEKWLTYIEYEFKQNFMVSVIERQSAAKHFIQDDTESPPINTTTIIVVIKYLKEKDRAFVTIKCIEKCFGIK